MTEISKDYLLKNLNEAQREAVSAERGNLLIIAGAGTGKTTVLVSRITWLLKVEEIPARNILAVTFTNKAANEMRTRIGALTGDQALRSMWSGTFHSICLRLLRSYAAQAGLSHEFTVLDTDGQKLLVKRIQKDLNISTTDFKPAQLAAGISRLKEKGIRAADFQARMIKYHEDRFSPSQDALFKVYPAYEEACRREGLVDFSELLLRTVELLEGNEDIRSLQHRRFKEILIDEFQDTNTLQYRFIRLMTGPESHVLAVGDDDQSIYGWRGADYTNMRRFLSDFPDVREIALMENYRSGQNILDMANVLISDNTDRLISKELKGTCGEGEKVWIWEHGDERDEASHVAEAAAALMRSGVRGSDIAILYRNNSLSAAVEAGLSARQVPYAIYGGLKFFERAEIQDALAYLRVLLNEADDTALLRIINVPSRKLGPRVVDQLRRIASERGCSVMQAISMIEQYGLDKAAPKELKSLAKKLQGFADLIASLKKLRQSCGSLGELVKETLEQTLLYEYYREKDEKEQRGQYDNQRHLNLEQLVSNAVSFEEQSGPREDQDEDTEGQERDPLLEFISSVSLAAGTELTGSGATASDTGAVNLMTIHASKGLEFRVVFLVGFEKGILPSSYVGQEDRQSEERRLAYVGITRARERLYLCYADRRMIYGRSELTGRSDFLSDIVKPYLGRQDKPFEFSRHYRGYY